MKARDSVRVQSSVILFSDLNSEVTCLTAGKNISPIGDDPMMQNGDRRKNSLKLCSFFKKILSRLL